MATAIEVDGLSKRYRLGQNLGRYLTLREVLASPAKRAERAEYVWRYATSGSTSSRALRWA